MKTQGGGATDLAATTGIGCCGFNAMFHPPEFLFFLAFAKRKAAGRFSKNFPNLNLREFFARAAPDASRANLKIASLSRAEWCFLTRTTLANSTTSTKPVRLL